MTLVPVAVEQFQGINLVDDPEEVGLGGAIDMLNVDLDKRGRVRSRDGFSKITAAAGATRYDSIFSVTAAASVSSVDGQTGTTADDSSVGTVAWSSATSLPATATVTGAATSHYLKATNFGFAVPSTATIVGILATITRSATGGPGSHYPRDNSVKLVKGGVIGGTDNAATGTWGSLSTAVAYGGASDLWGQTWTPVNVNASTFGAAISAVGDSATNAATISAVAITVYYVPQGSALVAGAASSRLDVIGTDGTVTATVATASDTQSTYVAFGSPSTSAVYIANSGTTIRKLAGTTFSAPAGMPKAKFVGLQTPDNRLVAANIGVIPTGAGSTASPSLVHFSGAGTPETWGANDYVYLTPGDNEDIQGVAAYRDFVIVFKSSKYFVFFGNSTDSTGNPVFNYRRVDGAGLVAPRAIAVTSEGVYFVDRRGVFVTTGGEPQRVSGPIDPLFQGGASAFFTPGIINPSAITETSAGWSDGRLYVAVPLGVATANSHTLVFDPATGQWLVWNIPIGAMAPSATNPQRLLFTYSSGTNDIGQYGRNAYTDDAGTAIVSYYRSGFGDLGYPGQEKVIRETELIGQGTPTFGWSRDFGAITSTSSQAVTLGTAPAVARKLHRKSQDGELLSWSASATSGAWQLNRITAYVRDVRGPAELTS